LIRVGNKGGIEERRRFKGVFVGEVIPQQELLLRREGRLGLAKAKHLMPTLAGEAFEGAMPFAETVAKALEFLVAGGGRQGGQACQQGVKTVGVAVSTGGFHHQGGKEGPEEHPPGIGIQLQGEPLQGKGRGRGAAAIAHGWVVTSSLLTPVG
jgi:hypothetical protein